MNLHKKEKTDATALNNHDRKILDKYTKYYSNFIESNTARTDVLPAEQYRTKK